MELEILLAFEFSFAERAVTVPVTDQSAVPYREVDTLTVEHKPSFEADLTIEPAYDKEVSRFNWR